jgi:hypothetical protein
MPPIGRPFLSWRLCRRQYGRFAVSLLQGCGPGPRKFRVAMIPEIAVPQRPLKASAQSSRLPYMAGKDIWGAVLSFLGWIAAGILAEIALAILIGVASLPHHAAPAPGDGALVTIFAIILVPTGAALGFARAMVTRGRRRAKG